jgi:sugar-specific transcriptional regulator TrmB
MHKPGKAQELLIRASNLLRVTRTPKTREEITREFYVPYGSFYRIIRMLQDLGWIRIAGTNRTHGAPALKYEAVRPDILPTYPKRCPSCRAMLWSAEHELKHRTRTTGLACVEVSKRSSPNTRS